MRDRRLVLVFALIFTLGPLVVAQEGGGQGEAPSGGSLSDGPGSGARGPGSEAGQSGVLAGIDGSVSANFKSLFYLLYDADYQEGTSGIASNAVRLEGSLYPAEGLGVEADYRLFAEVRGTSFAAGATTSPITPGGAYRVIDVREQAFPPESADADNAAVYQDLDRLFATVSVPFADIYLGRQAISWGAARVVRPTDVIVPFSFTAVDTEYRPGVDALRLRVPVGGFNEIDSGAIFGEDFEPEKSAYYLRPSFYLWDTDISLVGMLFRENLLTGFSASRAIGEAGAWFEAAYVVPDLVNVPADPYAEDYLSLSVGADRNLAADVYGYLEYHFNSAGTIETGDYLSSATGPAYSEGNVYLLGQHYLAAGGTYTAAPLLPIDALVVVNLTDGSGEITVSADYNFKENVYIGGGMLLGIGPEPETLGGVPVEYASEFGAYPQVFYTQVRMYF